jgi:hypothetical protein
LIELTKAVTFRSYGRVQHSLGKSKSTVGYCCLTWRGDNYTPSLESGRWFNYMFWSTLFGDVNQFDLLVWSLKSICGWCPYWLIQSIKVMSPIVIGWGLYRHNTIEAKKLWLLVANVLNLRIVQSSCKRDYSVLAWTS